VTSDQRTSGSGGGYIKQRHLHQEEDDTAAADAADAERASSMMRKWDLPPRLLCVYH